YLVWYSSPIFAGWTEADADGQVSATLALPEGLEGEHTIQAVGATSGSVASTEVTVAMTLAETGISAAGASAAAVLAIILGALALASTTVMRRTSRIQ